MKISLRFRYVVVVLAVVLTDRGFTELAFADEGDPMIGLYSYALTGLTFGLTVLYYKHFDSVMRTWLLVVLGSIGLMALESYGGWGSWMVYPHVFAKLLVLLNVFAVYAFHRRFGLPPFGLLMALILAGLMSNLLLLHPEALSMSAFLDNERGFGSNSTFLLPLLGLYFLNQYFTRGGLLRLAMFFVLYGLVIFLQHRSVWLAGGLGLLVNLLLLRRTQGVRLNMQRLTPVFIMPLLALTVGGTAAFIENPAVLQKLSNSIDDIRNSDKQGTGKWRREQFESYQPFIEENIIAGMRLKGFELPVQFYSTDTDAPVWRDGTGHHFHSFYIDRLFYFGVLGIVLVVVAPLVQVWRRLRQPVPLDATAAALIAYSASALMYGVSYDWPPFVYAFMGLMLAAAAPVPVAVPALRQPASPQQPSLFPASSPAHATA
ncbi:hypothetical protein F0P96_01135 [Hymenobacter busanensis]|uniref:Uncharacterized protein n=1 Tax=Hymenobacter busanensis TaxID=2607656 RepID=A0A7L4ZU51_9BACT|nr:hypothetical protein [Hymenobacter busanensis]KAA9339259.1 hypothetical protein F0P96_01135 [Hymenobacter busanensis]QHJ06979.1 hypothetical protein GUY19_06615 [Hymenobacter busanensis]